MSGGACGSPAKEVVSSLALARGIPGLICFALSIVGLIAELVFVCRKKNNFLLRLFIYLSVAIAMSQGVYTMYMALYLNPGNSTLCAVLEVILCYSTMVEFLFIFSINIVLLYKVYSGTFRSRTNSWIANWSNLKQKIVEVVFVLIHFGIPLIAVSVLMGVSKRPEYWSYKNTCYFAENTSHKIKCRLRNQYLFSGVLVVELVPVLIDLVLSVVCVTVLLLWWLWLQSKHFLRARMKMILKEIGLLLGYLLAYCCFRLLVETLDIAAHKNTNVRIVTYVIYPLGHAVIPISFFVYMFVDLRGCKDNRNRKQYTSDTIATDKFQTTPPSTRVSLPSDTAAHAINFLSPSTQFTETLPLLESMAMRRQTV